MCVNPEVIVERAWTVEHHIDQRAQALREASEAHHRYEEALGHKDDDWPTWYARHMAHMRPEVDW